MMMMMMMYAVMVANKLNIRADTIGIYWNIAKTNKLRKKVYLKLKICLRVA